MTKRTTSPRFTLRNAAVVAASLIVPLPILVSSITEAVLDHTNPENLDIRQDFANFDTMLLLGFGTLGLMIVLVAVLFVLCYRQTRDLRDLGLPIAILTLQLLLWVVILLLGNITNDAESAYNALS